MDSPALHLEVSQLSVVVNEINGLKTLLRDVSFSLAKGSVTGLVGGSGSGKSMTALAIMGLLPSTVHPTHGKITFFSGKEKFEVLDSTEEQLTRYRGKKVALVFQEPMTSLNPVMTCGQQVLECLPTSYPESQKKILELFREVQFEEPERIFNSYPHQLSGGQRQRIVIAMALAHEAQLLLLDEATTALDSNTQLQVMQLLKKLHHSRNLTMLFISHDLPLVAGFCDHIIVMHDGKVLEKNSTVQFLKGPQSPYAKTLFETYFKLAGYQKKENSEQKAILRIENLTVRYQKRRGIFSSVKQTVEALKNLSFALYKGEILGIVGGSGSGKTTLGNCLVQLVLPESGSIFYKEEKIFPFGPSLSSPQNQEIQMVFQDPFGSLNPLKSVESALLEILKSKNPKDKRQQLRKRAVELLTTVQLENLHLSRYPHQLSGGQRQRVSIARALAVDPSVLILDESLSSLDAFIRQEIIDLVLKLRDEKGLSILIITHDLGILEKLCDRVLVMHQGRKIEEGTVREIISSPKEPYTKSLVEAIPKVPF